MSRSALVLAFVAAILFAVGGVFMKLSNGLARAVPGSIALGLFLGGAVAQTVAMKHAELGIAYVFVLASKPSWRSFSARSSSTRVSRCRK